MKSKLSLVSALIFIAMLGAFGLVQAVPITVPGTSDPWLAGMPNGSTASLGDVAPAQSPVQVLGLSLGLRGFLTFTGATGGVLNFGGCPPGCDPIDGGNVAGHSTGAENGISDVAAPVNALLGLFLDGSQPDSSAPPVSLNFITLGIDFLTLSPLLKQVFFIGDGLTSTSAVQQFDIPSGATRLFLGTMDGFGWFNNTGAINIEVTQVIRQQPPSVPEPTTVALFLVGFVGLGYLRRRNRMLGRVVN